MWTVGLGVHNVDCGQCVVVPDYMVCDVGYILHIVGAGLYVVIELWAVC